MDILIVEDEPKLAAFMKEALENMEYSVEVVYDGFMGRKKALTEQYQLIVLDIVIPYMNGLELCKEIRSQNASVPILMLTALGTTEDKVNGLEAGADDYLVKPFELKEFLARVKALTRRVKGFTEIHRELKVANLTLNLDRRLAFRNQQSIELTSKEFALLEFLLRNKGRVISRTEIAEKVWDIDFDTGTNVVDVYINFLRKKIDRDFEPKLIHTQIGSGYFLDIL
jgi:two-component system copper resistance phosphate regulon response regulator CusR